MALLTRAWQPRSCRRQCRAGAWLWLLSICFACAPLPRSQAQPRAEEVKAAFVFNFTQFVEWPTNTLSTNAPFVIGIYGDNPSFQAALEEIVRGESIRGHPLLVRRLRNPAESRDVRILYIAARQEDDWPKILRLLGTRPVLTVSEIENFARRGGMIRLYADRNRVRLRINHKNTREAGLTLSSKLLRVAQVIDAD